ncbi:MAG: calcium-binding protein [Pirellulaceae bacterium]
MFKFVLPTVVCCLLILIDPATARSDRDLSEIEYLEGELLRLDTDVNADLDLTRIGIFQNGNQVEFVIEEYRQGMLVDIDTISRSLNSIIRIWVVSARDCGLEINTGLSFPLVQVHGSDRDDIIRGADRAYGRAGNDRIYDCRTGYGGPGNDLLVGCNNAYGQEGNDIMHAIDRQGESSRLAGGRGNDWLIGGDADDNLFGEEGDDYLFGGNGADVLFGGFDFDVCYGGSGDDVMDAGHWDPWLGSSQVIPAQAGEILYGQAGADVFVRWDLFGTVVQDMNDFRDRDGDTEETVVIDSLFNYSRPGTGAGPVLGGGIR